METLFNYNSRMAFGAGARHLSISKTENNRYVIQRGTPQQPSKSEFISLTEKEEEEIKSLQNNAYNADYIEFVILR